VGWEKRKKKCPKSCRQKEIVGFNPPERAAGRKEKNGIEGRKESECEEKEKGGSDEKNCHRNGSSRSELRQSLREVNNNTEKGSEIFERRALRRKIRRSPGS